MARPLKTGLDYFPMDVNMDDKVELIEAKHGITGFGVLIKMYQKIYKEGYFIKWNEEALLLFSKRINVDINKVIDVINDCFKYQLFDEKLYKEYSIITSPGIQKRFLQAIDRRKEIELIKQYIIVDVNGINVNINWINDDISTQSKVKKSKVDNSKEKNTKTADELKFEKAILENYSQLFKMKEPLTYDQHLKLVEKYGRLNVDAVYKRMHNWPDLCKKNISANLTARKFMKDQCPELC